MMINKTRQVLETLQLAFEQGGSLPAPVKDAMSRDFGEDITGYLYGVQVYGYSIIGIIFGDRNHRFLDGTPIQTSSVVNADVINEYVVVETLNSRYVVCEVAPGEELFRPTWQLH